MTTFGLVHGAYHGAWCWDVLRPELEARGHRVLSVDLPCEDPSAGGADYAEAAIEAFASAADDLTVVGHSLGGLTIPLIAARRPVGRMVFLSAMVPRIGHAFGDDATHPGEPDMATGAAPEDGPFTDASGATRWVPDVAAGYFFSDCSAETAAWAASRLRGQFWRITEEQTPLTTWPDVPSTAVIGSRDPVLNPAWLRWTATTLLAADPIELECGDSAFLSVPGRLAEVLSSLDASA